MKNKEISSQKISLGFIFSPVPNLIHLTIFWGAFLLILFPLFGDYGTLLYPHGRDIFFRMITEILLISYLILILYDPQFRPRFSWIAFFLVFYWVISGLATLFSHQQTFSLWGITYRGQGFFSLTHYVALFFILSSTLKNWEAWKKLFIAAFVVSLMTVAIGLFVEKANVPRIASTLNNPNFYGAYLLFVVFLTASFFLIIKDQTLRLILGIGLLGQLIALFFTYTRGAYLGLLMGSLLFVLLLPPLYKKIKRAALLGFIGALVLFGLFFALGQYLHIGNSEIQFIDRFINIASIQRGATSRFEAWQTGWMGMLSRPWLGYGLENFIIPFDTFYSGSLDHTAFIDTWYDRAHNIVIDTGASTGFPGLGIYLGLLGAVYTTLYGVWRATQYAQTKTLLSGLFAILTAYVIQNIFNLDTTTSFLYFIFFLAFVANLNNIFILQGYAKKEKLHSPRLSWQPLLLFVLALPLLIFSFKEYHIDFLAANYNLNKAEDLFNQHKYTAAFRFYEQGIKINAPPVNPHLRYRYASALLQEGLNQKLKQPEAAKIHFQKALEILDENIAKEFPYFTRNYLLGGVISTLLFEMDEKEYGVRSHEYFKKAIERSPRHGVIYLEWAKADFIAQNYEQGTEKIQKAISINPKFADPYWLFGIGLLYEGKEEEAYIQFQKAKMLGKDIDSKENIMQLIFVYDQLKQYNKAIELQQKLVEKNPRDPQEYASLAVLYKKSGDLKKAMEVAHSILEIDPEAKEDVERFLQQLEQ